MPYHIYGFTHNLYRKQPLAKVIGFYKIDSYNRGEGKKKDNNQHHFSV